MLRGAFDQNLTREKTRQMKLKFVTLPTYWIHDENLSGKARRAIQLASWGLQVFGHPAVYAMQPDWPDASANYRQLCQRIDHYASTFGDSLACVDVVNEPLHHPTLYTYDLYRRYRARRPAVPRRVNEYDILTGILTDTLVATLSGCSSIYERIGVQAHVPAAEASYATVWKVFTVKHMRSQLEKLLPLQKRIDLSEVSIPSAGNGWTPTRQRDFLARVVEAAQGIVETIGWWEPVDGKIWNPKSGLFEEDGTPKPALDVWLSIT